MATALREPFVIIIDRPFYLWIERPGMSVPICSLYLTEEHWKDPGDLDL